MDDRYQVKAPAPLDGTLPGDPPQISVIIPAYQAAETIGEAVDSALSQRPAPLEVIVSDDGSNDDLAEALRPFGDRVRVVRGPNGGQAMARNRAASVARGDLLALLDADDIWLPGRLAAFRAAAAARPDLAVLTTDAVEVRDGVRNALTYYAIREFPVDDQALAILRNSFIFGAGAIRTDVFRAAGGYYEAARSFAEDWDLWLRLLLAGHRAGLIEVPLYEYRRRSGSSTAQRLDLALGVLGVMDRARPLVSADDQQRQLRETIQSWRESAAEEAVRSIDPRMHGLAARAALGRRVAARRRLKYGFIAAAPSRLTTAVLGVRAVRS